MIKAHKIERFKTMKTRTICGQLPRPCRRRHFCFVFLVFLVFFAKIAQAQQQRGDPGEDDDFAAQRQSLIPPTPTFHPPSGAYPGPVFVRVDPGRQTRRKKRSATTSTMGGESECEKIVVTVDGKPPEEEDMEEDMEEEKTRIDYLHKPVLLRREGVHVVKAVCTTGSRFGTQNQAEYVVLPSLATTGARGGVGLLGEEEDQGGGKEGGGGQLIDKDHDNNNNNNNGAKRIAGVIFLGIFLIIGMLATLGVCGAAFQSFRGEFGRGAQRFVGPGVGNNATSRRSRLGSVGSGSAADFVNWFERNRERAVASGSRLLSDLEMSSSDVPRAGSNTHPGSASQANEANEFTLDDPDEANKRD